MPIQIQVSRWRRQGSKIIILRLLLISFVGLQACQDVPSIHEAEEESRRAPFERNEDYPNTNGETLQDEGTGMNYRNNALISGVNPETHLYDVFSRTGPFGLPSLASYVRKVQTTIEMPAGFPGPIEQFLNSLVPLVVEPSMPTGEKLVASFMRPMVHIIFDVDSLSGLGLEDNFEIEIEMPQNVRRRVCPFKTPEVWIALAAATNRFSAVSFTSKDAGLVMSVDMVLRSAFFPPPVEDIIADHVSMQSKILFAASGCDHVNGVILADLTKTLLALRGNLAEALGHLWNPPLDVSSFFSESIGFIDVTLAQGPSVNEFGTAEARDRLGRLDDIPEFEPAQTPNFDHLRDSGLYLLASVRAKHNVFHLRSIQENIFALFALQILCSDVDQGDLL